MKLRGSFIYFMAYTQCNYYMLYMSFMVQTKLHYTFSVCRQVGKTSLILFI